MDWMDEAKIWTIWTIWTPPENDKMYGTVRVNSVHLVHTVHPSIQKKAPILNKKSKNTTVTQAKNLLLQ